MVRRKLPLLVIFSSLALIVLVGCPRVAPPENEVTWAIKAATGHLTQATPREWQAVSEVIDSRIPQVDVTLTDAQAEALTDFIRANDLNTVDEIVQLVEEAQQDPNSVVSELVIPDSVTALFTADPHAFDGVLDELMTQF